MFALDLDFRICEIRRGTWNFFMISPLIYSFCNDVSFNGGSYEMTISIYQKFRKFLYNNVVIREFETVVFHLELEQVEIT